MKLQYIVILDDKVEEYCQSLEAAKRCVNEMVDLYCCDEFPEKELRRDVIIFKGVKLK